MPEDVELQDLDGVGSKTAEKLRESGYKSIESIAAQNAGSLTEDVDIGDDTAKKIIRGARDLAGGAGFETGNEKLKERSQVTRIPTGSETFNELLGGGIESQSITEVYGQFGSGKTQVAHQAAVNVQDLGDEDETPGAIYIDTEDTFIPERIEQMAEAQGKDPEAVLENIFVARAFDTDHQVLLAKEAKDIIEENNISLVVVDSLTGHFRSEYVGRGKLAERQQKLNKHTKVLQKLAKAHNVSVLITNQVMSNPDQMFGDPTKAIGGHILGHNSTTRIYLRKSKKNKRIARLVDSPYLPEGEAVFKITENGIEDD